MLWMRRLEQNCIEPGRQQWHRGSCWLLKKSTQPRFFFDEERLGNQAEENWLAGKTTPISQIDLVSSVVKIN